MVVAAVYTTTDFLQVESFLRLLIRTYNLFFLNSVIGEEKPHPLTLFPSSLCHESHPLLSPNSLPKSNTKYTLNDATPSRGLLLLLMGDHLW